MSRIKPLPYASLPAVDQTLVENCPALSTYISEISRYRIDLPSPIYHTIHSELLGPYIHDFSEKELLNYIDCEKSHIYCPTNYQELEALSYYTNQTTCLLCGKPLISRICEHCHLNYNIAPHLHPTLISFLTTYYRDSIDNLFQRVRRGESLTQDETTRFLPEIDYHYWQLLRNSGLNQIDPKLREHLFEKFSLPFYNGERILL